MATLETLKLAYKIKYLQTVFFFYTEQIFIEIFNSAVPFYFRCKIFVFNENLA